MKVEFGWLLILLKTDDFESFSIILKYHKDSLVSNPKKNFWKSKIEDKKACQPYEIYPCAPFI